jgi:hypothetical protein
MADEREISGAALARLERELAQMKEGLGLLGARPCSVCGRYLLTANPGNLFHTGQEFVCYPCLSNWWRERCPQLDTAERGAIESKLMRWLIQHHNAQVVRELKDLPPSELQEVHLVAACPECHGTGKLAGERCRHCLGNRNLWVITMKGSAQHL